LSRSWLIVALLLLYVPGLGSVGFLMPDEPRYASIGREMARSGDWITPRLDGSPWFEKPPLLYWMTAAATRAGLRDEWAARLPVALASLAFLIFFSGVLEREFSLSVALAATVILGTSAGWIAYSFGAVTDLPMSAALGAAMLIALFDTRPRRGYLAGALLGLAILAKAFVPLVLFAPVWLIARGKRVSILVAAAAVAAPWHLLCWMRNGPAFWNDYFWKQQVERFVSPALQHVQPVWYYLPVLLAGLLPWTPLLALTVRRKIYDDPRLRFLLVWTLLGLVFFSAARNKLPGYVLPLMPAVAILLAVGLARAPGKHWWIAACVLPLAMIPAAVRVLPEALLTGITKVHWSVTPGVVGFALLFLAMAGLVWWLGRGTGREAPSPGRVNFALLAAALTAVAGIGYLKAATFPLLDRQVSARAFWRAHQPLIENACVDSGVRRDWQYELNYYADRALPQCQGQAPGLRVVQKDRALAIENP
jgi:4-amino-4-deoxy-L-arabinose transferase